jgi:hypothetical protein
VVHIKKATSLEGAPRQKHVRSECGDFRGPRSQLTVIAFQSVSCTLERTTPPSHSGLDYAFDQPKSKRSKP